MKRKLTYIEFLDHIGQPSAESWTYADDVPRAASTICKIGWVLHEDDDVVVITGTIGTAIGGSHPESYADYMVIIKRTITLRRSVKLQAKGPQPQWWREAFCVRETRAEPS